MCTKYSGFTVSPPFNFFLLSTAMQSGECKLSGSVDKQATNNGSVCRRVKIVVQNGEIHPVRQECFPTSCERGCSELHQDSSFVAGNVYENPYEIAMIVFSFFFKFFSKKKKKKKKTMELAKHLMIEKCLHRGHWPAIFKLQLYSSGAFVQLEFESDAASLIVQLWSSHGGFSLRSYDTYNISLFPSPSFPCISALSLP